MLKKIKEKINQNEYIIFVKKMWGNKKYRSLFVLALYFIFFFILIVGLKSSYQNIDNNKVDNFISFDEIKKEYNNSTEYSYELFVNEESLIIGNLENGINSFIYNDNHYKIINNNIYKEENDNLNKVNLNKEDIILSMVDKIMLENLVDYVSVLEKNDVINNNYFSLDYEIPNSYFLLDKEGIAKVNISSEMQNKINKITIDLTNYKKEEYIIKILIGDENDWTIK